MTLLRRTLRRLCEAVLAWLDRRDYGDCTGLSASWCPVCGDCTCRDPPESRNDAECPLHGDRSKHAMHDEAREVPT